MNKGPSPMPATSVERRRRVLTTAERTAIAAFTLLHVAVLWAFSYVPTQDGPSHLENAHLMLQGSVAGDVGGFHDFYRLAETPSPAWLDHQILAMLQRVVAPLIAEKILLTAYVIGMVLAFAYCLASIKRTALFCVPLVLPFAFNRLFHMGFYGFVCSVIPFLLLAGFAYRHRESLGRWRVALVVFALAALVGSLHLVTFMVSAVLVVSLVLLDLSRQLTIKGRSARSLVRSVINAAPPLLAVIVPLAAVLMFASTQARPVITAPPVLYRTAQLVTLSSLATFDAAEYAVALALVLLLAAMLVRARKSVVSLCRENRPITLIMLAYLVMYLLLPDELFGGSYLIARLGLFVILTFMLWLGAGHEAWKFRVGFQVGVYAVSAAMLVLHAAKYAELNDYLREYVSAGRVMAPGATLLPLVVDGRGRDEDNRVLARTVMPFKHAGGLIALERGLVNLANYEANAGYFPVVYRPEANPYVHLGDVEEEPPALHRLAFPSTQPQQRSVDYILVWGRANASRAELAKMEPLDQLLVAGYERIYVSEPRGLAEVWKSKRPSPGARP